MQHRYPPMPLVCAVAGTSGQRSLFALGLLHDTKYETRRAHQTAERYPNVHTSFK